MRCRVEFMIESLPFASWLFSDIHLEGRSPHPEFFQVFHCRKPAVEARTRLLIERRTKRVLAGIPNPKRLLKSRLSILAQENMFGFPPVVQPSALLQNRPPQPRPEPLPRF